MSLGDGKKFLEQVAEHFPLRAANETVALATYGVMGGLGVGLMSTKRWKGIGTSVAAAAGIGVAFTLASLLIERTLVSHLQKAAPAAAPVRTPEPPSPT